MKFDLPPLPYDFDALAPTIDEETMRLHHDKHHQAYVDKLNKTVEADPKLQGRSLEQLLTNVSDLPKAVRDNGGGHWNHSFFWQSMKPGGSSPHGSLAAAIDRSFSSFDAMREKFNAAGARQFGSGWVWLIATESGELKILSTPNQDNPLMDVVETRGTPLLGNDLWEHAYYLTYNNRRADYLKAWWDVVDWDKAEERFARVQAGAVPAEPELTA